MELDLILYMQQNMTPESRVILFAGIIFICAILMIIDNIYEDYKS